MTILYSHLHEWPVYPGHPVTIALEVLLAYKRNLDEAFAPSLDKDGQVCNWHDALGNSSVSGAGGNVYQGLDLLQKIRTKELTPGQAIEWGMKSWERQTKIGGDHRDKFEEGHAQAERMTWPLLDQLYRAMAEGKL